MLEDCSCAAVSTGLGACEFVVECEREGTGGSSSVEVALIWATRFFTDAFLVLNPCNVMGSLRCVDTLSIVPTLVLLVLLVLDLARAWVVFDLE